MSRHCALSPVVLWRRRGGHFRHVPVNAHVEEEQEEEDTTPRSSPRRLSKAKEATEAPTVEEAELGDLKDQFLAQETLLGQLKGVLRSNEEKLQNKEKEVQVSQL